MPFTKVIRDTLVRTPASLRSSVATLGRLKLKVRKFTEIV